MKKIRFKALDMRFNESTTNEKGEVIMKSIWRKVRYNSGYFPKK